jgi:3-isopropylmalate dehydrogenase
MKATLAVLPGDGVGPEVTAQAVAALRAVAARFGHDLTLIERVVGQQAIFDEGTALSDETFEICARSDAILFGATGSLPARFARAGGARPEDALYRLRRGLDLFANIRPVRPMPELAPASPLKADVITGTDLVFVREMSAGLYYGFAEDTDSKPSRITGTGSEAVAVDTLRYTHGEIERVLREAFELAARRRGHLTSVDKANVLSSSVLWRRCVEEMAEQYPSVTVEHLLVDACAMKLVQDPTGFDVVVTENLFGDILTDEASVITGSIGMLPSASLGPTRPDSCARVALYEPIHGSAPTIAGQDRANPIGAILSAAMLLRHSLDLPQEAAAIEDAVAEVIRSGFRTEDIAEPGATVVGTAQLGELVAARLTAAGAILA